MNNTPFHLHNKTIFITGASSGIGRQIALSTAEMGGKLIITGRDKNKLEETLKLLKGGGHIAFIADLNNLEQIDDLIKKLPKEEQMNDSLEKLLKQPIEVQFVKLADRIVNLKEPPHYWNVEKRIKYQEEAKVILEKLGMASLYLAKRLEEKIENYEQYFV